MTLDISNESVDDFVKNFTQFLHDKAFDTFGSKNDVKHKQPNKQWFDENFKMQNSSLREYGICLTVIKMTRTVVNLLDHEQNITT